MMELEEKAEEILETLWINTEEEKKEYVPLGTLQPSDKEAIDRLIATGCISVSGNEVRLTDTGYPEATNVVRRHRLAERLLVDILGSGESFLHEKACKFEHLLDRGLDENICSLLGHPKVCPHGKLIPPGKCCLEEQMQVQKVVASLSQMTVGQGGKVAYIYAPEANQLQKLMAMGILPGAPISLVQKFPSHVFQVRQTQFAVDRSIADAIYVRLMEERESIESVDNRSQRKYRRQRGRLARRLGLR